jgi:hypothetical protein
MPCVFGPYFSFKICVTENCDVLFVRMSRTLRPLTECFADIFVQFSSWMNFGVSICPYLSWPYLSVFILAQCWGVPCRHISAVLWISLCGRLLFVCSLALLLLFCSCGSMLFCCGCSVAAILSLLFCRCCSVAAVQIAALLFVSDAPSIFLFDGSSSHRMCSSTLCCCCCAAVRLLLFCCCCIAADLLPVQLLLFCCCCFYYICSLALRLPSLMQKTELSGCSF